MKKYVLLAIALASCASAELKLPALISDGMVLQQKQANLIWGWDDPGTTITVTIGGQKHSAKAGEDRRWEVKLDSMPASSDPMEMKVAGSTELAVKDILVGEVWLCSGQSNMGWTVNQSFGTDLAKLTADNAGIRLITMPKVGSQEKQPDFQGKWETAGSETIGNFSAVGYYFGKLLHEALGVPVGLINNAWGGSSAEAWVRRDLLEQDQRFGKYMTSWKNKEATYDYAPIKAKYDQEKAAWKKAKTEATAAGTAIPSEPKWPENELTNQHRPGNLYSGTLFPAIGYGMRGVIWYQGESNANRADNYNELMSLLISSWREAWGQGDFPFYFVQLADFMDEKNEPEESSWAELREAQTRTLNEVKNTGQAVIIDLGETNDIHPREKRSVAERLARWALAKDYGFKIAHRSPDFKSMEIQDGKAILTFDHVGGGLKTSDVNQVRGFAVRGEDGKWTFAEGKIIGNDRIEVTATGVAKPTAVRYAWANNPVNNVVTLEGLPLSPFRTDGPNQDPSTGR